MAVTSTDNQTAASPTVEAVASKDASSPVDETTDPAPAETVVSQPQRPCRSVQALATRAPRRLCTTPQPSCVLNESCPRQCAPPAPTPSRHL